MKTLVKMKSTKMGKDDDSALTVKYNEGGEYRIGPELLKAFQDMDALEVLGEKKKPEPKKEVEEEKSLDEEPKADSENEEVKEDPKKKKKFEL